MSEKTDAMKSIESIYNSLRENNIECLMTMVRISILDRDDLPEEFRRELVEQLKLLVEDIQAMTRTIELPDLRGLF